MTDSRHRVTVVIPVKNGGRGLRDCLSAVSTQKTPFDFDVLCVDSGSMDGSIDVLKEFHCRVIQIPPETFGHGRTRNLAISNTQAEFVAMLTQDAVPATEHWLAELVAPLLEDEHVAGVFGPHLPHPKCNPTEAYMLERHFQNFGAETTKFFIKPGAQGWREYEERQGFYRFFSDNNAALRRSVWSVIPYRDVEFMEDQLWAADILEAGYAKVYAPKAAVRHSHNYSALTMFRRAFDESRFAREYLDPPGAPGLKGWAKTFLRQSREDIVRLKRDAALRPSQRAGWAVRSIARNGGQAAGWWLGDRYVLLPEPIVRRFSLHHALKGDAHVLSQSSVVQLVQHAWRRSLRQRGFLDTGTLALRQVIHTAREGRQKGWTWALINLRRRGEELLSSPARTPWWEASHYRLADASPPLPLPKEVSGKVGTPKQVVVNWVIPPIGQGSGGHMTIFRIIQRLEQRGHLQRVYFLHDSQMTRGAFREQALVHEWFLPIDAPVRPLRGEMLPADIAMATAWETAYAVRSSTCAPTRCYFIQDFEPAFFPHGAPHQMAEDTYRFGFRAICASRWLERLMQERYGMETHSFNLGVDPNEYFPEIHPKPRRRRVFMYVRPYTARRGFELAALALKRVKEEMPEIEVHVAGYEIANEVMPFDFVGHGLLSTANLRSLYSTCDVAVCLSFTNYSLMPQEIAACGCPVVELDLENTRAAYPEGAVVLAPPNVRGIADATLSLLRDETLRRQQVRRGLAYARSVTWDAAADAVESALLEFAFGQGKRSRRRSEKG